jgi:Golgi nucleoside diphosphatase
VGLQKRTIKRIENLVMVPQIYNSKSLSDLRHEISILKEKKSGLQQLLKKSYLTPILNIIAKYIPEGVWLDRFSFLSNQGKPILILGGISYNQDSDKEMDLVYEFFNKIKDSQEIKGAFNEMKVQNVKKDKIGEYNIVRFTIQGYMK